VYDSPGFPTGYVVERAGRGPIPRTKRRGGERGSGLPEADPEPETEPSIEPPLAAEVTRIIEIVPAGHDALALKFLQRTFEAIADLFSTYVMKFLLGRQGNVLAQARPAAS
jgi:hypothetical protein